MDELGPVDYAIIAFPGNRFDGRIAPALAELSDAGTVRIIDVAFVLKDEDGTVTALDLEEFDDAEVRSGFERTGVAEAFFLNEEDLLETGAGLAPGSSAAVIVWENTWARKISEAVRAADGELREFGRIPHAVVEAARTYVPAGAGA